jgi:hypothetical protein
MPENVYSMRKGEFSIELGCVFPGYTTGQTWNGWAIPYFEYLQALMILEMVCANGEGQFVYVESEDCFLLDDGWGDLIEIHSRIILAEGIKVKVYDFNLGWVWDEIGY